jgi:heterodisulfide reductase subunit A
VDLESLKPENEPEAMQKTDDVEEPAPVQKRALVIGGGIAGIQAALDLADARIPVTLVEKSPSLGGRMAQLDKTFPTMDCSI